MGTQFAEAGTWKRDVHAANNVAFCALYNYDMHAQNTAGVDRAYKDTVTFAPGAPEDGKPTCARTDFVDNYPRPCDCSDANGAMPTASSEICETAKMWELGPDQVEAGMENFKTLVCEEPEEDEDAEEVEATKEVEDAEEVEATKEVEDAEEVEDAKEVKDETESGFQSNFLSATLIALCALFKL